MWEIINNKVNKKKKIIFEIVFEMVHVQPYEGFQKKPHHIPVPSACHWNLQC
jgi:hypothetical protein